MNEDDAAKAIATLNGLQLQNKKIKVAYSRNGDKVKGANLYIKGLPASVTQDMLQEMFTKFGTIIQARVITDQTTGQSKGVGFVLFDTRDQAESAMAEMDGATPPGCTQPLTVKFAEDNAGKARPPTAPMPGGVSAIPTRGGYNTARGGYTRGGFAGPMRRGGSMNRYNPMAGGAAYGGGAAAGNGGYGYEDATYSQMPQNGGASGDGGFVLFVYNIGPDADESALWQLFTPFGSILKVNVIRDFQKNVGKGYGFVTMSSYAEAMNAIQQLNGYKYYGKPLQVSFKSNKN
jgi:ELAV/HuD family splicing factor